MKGHPIRAIHVINSLGVGGAERQLSMLVGRGCDAVSHVVRPLVASNSEIEIDGSVIRGGSGLPIFSIGRALVGAIVDCYKAKRPVLVGWMYHSWVIALMAHMMCFGKVPVVLYCRHGVPSGLDVRTRLIAVLCLRWAAMLGLTVVFNSESALLAHQALVRGLKARVIPNGVEVPAIDRRKRSVAGGGVIGFLGRNHTDKGADRIIEIVPEVLASFPGWAARICGPGMSLLGPQILEALARSGVGQDRVVVSDAIKDIDQFFAEVDLLIVPSRTESFPNVVVEAAVRGVIPICIGVGDIPWILSGKVPFASDVASLKELLLEICSLSWEERSSMGNALAKSVSERFGVERTRDLHLALWRELLRC